MGMEAYMPQREGQPNTLRTDDAPVEDAQAVCGMCGDVLHPELDDIFVELCRACEQTALKGRQTRSQVPNSHPKRLPKQ